MHKQFAHILMITVLALLLAGCMAETADPTAAQTAADTVPAESTGIVVSETTVPTEIPKPAGTAVTMHSVPYLLQIDQFEPEIHYGPGYDFGIASMRLARGIYTIVEESVDSEGNLWGKLKSGIGWVDVTGMDFSQIQEEAVPAETSGELPYLVRVDRFEQAVFQGPGFDYGLVDMLVKRGEYTIVEESVDYEGNLWGKLKSGIGWLNLTQMRSVEYQSALLTVNHADDAALRGEHYAYSTGREYCIPVLIRAYGKLRDVTIFELVFSDGYCPGADLFTLPEMTESVPLVAELDFPGDFSMYGIRFTDETGDTHVYSVYCSLRNGEMQLSDCSFE